LKAAQETNKTDAMQKNLTTGFSKRIQMELDLWYESREIEYMKNLEIKGFNERVSQQHKDFAMNSGLYLLTSFLTRKNVKGMASIQNMEMHSINIEEDDKNSGILKEDIYFELSGQGEIYRTEFKNWLRSSDGDSKETDAATRKKNFKKKLQSKTKYINIRQVLQSTPLPSLEGKMNIDDYSLIYARVDDENIEPEKQDKKININASVASATVAAFLRVVYASIKFSPDPECTKRSVNHIKEMETFKKITLLCYKAGWTNGCIGYKYLRIFRNVIEQDDMIDATIDTSGGTSKEKKKRVKSDYLAFVRSKLHFFEILSKAIQEILTHVTNNFAKQKVKNFSTCEEEIYLISEIARCCKLIIEKVSLINLMSIDEEDMKKYEKIVGHSHLDFGSRPAYNNGPQLPQKRLLDWLIGKLITKDVINTLLRLKTIDYSKDMVESGGDYG
jgi:hypothetical protein